MAMEFDQLQNMRVRLVRLKDRTEVLGWTRRCSTTNIMAELSTPCDFEVGDALKVVVESVSGQVESYGRVSSNFRSQLVLDRIVITNWDESQESGRMQKRDVGIKFPEFGLLGDVSSHDLSRRGIGIDAAFSFPVGYETTIELTYDDKTVEVSGVVKHCTELETPGMFRIGFEIKLTERLKRGRWRNLIYGVKVS